MLESCAEMKRTFSKSLVHLIYGCDPADPFLGKFLFPVVNSCISPYIPILLHSKFIYRIIHRIFLGRSDLLDGICAWEIRPE